LNETQEGLESAWLQPSDLSVLTEKLGYSLQDWQREVTESILEGKDVVLTAGTGRGKTTLLYAPLLITRLHNPQAIGLSVVPTKALGLDQVCFSLGSQLPAPLRAFSRNMLPAQRESLLLLSMKILSGLHQARARTYSKRY
jgi:superfamily II DNA helicase RecQ